MEHIVQDRGNMISRGEVQERIQSDIDYLVKLKQEVDKLLQFPLLKQH